MDLNTNIELTPIWGRQTFSQDEWEDINYLIGPNGTGKTLFAESLKSSIHRFSVRYLNAERLSGMEQDTAPFSRSQLSRGFNLQNEDSYYRQAESTGLSSDAYMRLREKPDLKIKIQAILSEFFDRELRLEVEEGYLKPKMRDTNTSTSYDLREDESHGLKELISLLTLIHDDGNDILIIDEPELHLHPQYQKFLLREIRKLAGDPTEGSKAFFLITHSPSMVELRDINDLLNIYSFRNKSEPPFTVDDFSDEDRYHIKNLLPRLNTRHKEVLFSKQPILVEGYTDEQIFTLAIEKHNHLTASPESEMIGVGGKDSLNSFFKFCQALGLEPRIITDLDTAFSGRLRQTLSEVDQVERLLQDQGLGPNVESAIGRASRELNEIIDSIQTIDAENEDLKWLQSNIFENDEAGKNRYLVYRFIAQKHESFQSELKPEKISSVRGILGRTFDVLSDCGYYFLEKGELEDYLRGEDSSPIPASSSQKTDLFDETHMALLDAQCSEDVEEVIGELLPMLEQVTATRTVDLVKHLEDPVSDWVHDVQKAVKKGEISSVADLKNHDNVGQENYERLFSIEKMEINNGQASIGFKCTIRLDASLDPEERTYTFTETTTPHSMNLN